MGLPSIELPSSIGDKWPELLQAADLQVIQQPIDKIHEPTLETARRIRERLYVVKTVDAEVSVIECTFLENPELDVKLVFFPKNTGERKLYKQVQTILL